MEITPEAHTPEIVRREPVSTAVVRGTVRMEELPQFYDRAYPLVASVLEQQGLQPLEAVGHYLTPPGQTIELEVGFTTVGRVEEDSDVVASSLPGGDVVRMTHLGPYEELAESWGRLASWIGQQGRRPGRSFWEVYVTEPSPEADPATMRTDLYWLLDS